jgi:hypothetical protein
LEALLPQPLATFDGASALLIEAGKIGGEARASQNGRIPKLELGNEERKVYAIRWRGVQPA